MPLLASVLAALLASLLSPLLSLAGSRPDDLGPREGRLKACPSSPNCVHSDDTGSAHVEPFVLVEPGQAAFARAREVLADMPRTRIVAEEPGYLHAECRTALLGFVDDLELLLQGDRIAVRSASRLGSSDLGANRKRVEALRERLRTAGVVR